MPYRAMLFSIFTVVLALLAVGMWVRTVGPVVADVDAVAASEPRRPVRPQASGAATQGEMVADFSKNLHKAVPGVMILSLVLICLLLVVGFAATFREWARFTTQRRVGRRERTAYVDAWKLAGERASAERDEEDPEETEE
jgi:hypothetical protein